MFYNYRSGEPICAFTVAIKKWEVKAMDTLRFNTCDNFKTLQSITAWQKAPQLLLGEFVSIYLPPKLGKLYSQKIMV